jgi:hypothetical protein
MPPSPDADFPCPRCGAMIAGRLSRCPKCQVRLADYGKRVPWCYDLASIMLFTLAFAVGLGLSLRLDTAGLGIPILLIGPAAVLRAAPIYVHRRREGRPRDIGVLLDSCFVVLVLVVSALIAFTAVCLPIGCMTFNLGPAPYFWTAFAAGGLAACFVLYRIGRRTFPPRD